MRFYDRVKETTATTGTGTITLAGAVSGFVTFGSVFAVGDRVGYCIEVSSTSWEVGIGVMASSTTLARTQVTASTNGGSALNLGGSATVFCCLPGRYISRVPAAGQALALATGQAMP